jgi:trans-aconitate 2-methyltransferase
MPPTDTWDPAQYEKFRREREQPFYDLLALVRPGPAMRVIDLGCGTGKQTRLLHERLNARETIGLDRSARMLESAKEGPSSDALRFELGTIESFPSDAPYDVVFSNAALHWIEDHHALVPRLVGALNPGGQLAFQVPAMHHHLSHVVADELAGTEPFRTALRGWRRPQPVLEPEEYARLLFRAGIAAPKVGVTIYPHVLDGREEVVEWMKGTLLTEYEKHLSPEHFDQFLSAYREGLLAKLQDERPFLFPFRRILCWGQRDEAG